MSVLAAYAVPHPPLILSEIGHGEEKGIQKTIDAYRAVMREAASLHPETVVVTSPHTVMYADYFHISPSTGRKARGNFGRFGAPQVQIEAEYDAEFIAALKDACRKDGIPAGTQGEREPQLDHATMIPLQFLKESGASGYKIVRIGLSGLSPLTHYRLGECIALTAKILNRRTIIIASGDLSHKLKADGPYGFSSSGPVFDQMCTEALEKGDFSTLLGLDPELCENAAECGLRSFWIMAGTLDRKSVKCSLLSYEGPFGVGYGVASFRIEGKDETRNCGGQYAREEHARMEARKKAEDPYVRLARLSLETYIKTQQYAKLPPNLPTALTSQKAGAFVSLKKHGQLRGCIGTTGPTRPSLAKEILYNAVAAAVSDPRFPPVTEEELPELAYSVDVLGTPEKATVEDLNVHRYGVIVSSGSRRGLLLPDLAGIDIVSQQISIARQKGGISPREPIQLERFEVVRHK